MNQRGRRFLGTSPCSDAVPPQGRIIDAPVFYPLTESIVNHLMDKPHTGNLSHLPGFCSKFSGFGFNFLHPTGRITIQLDQVIDSVTKRLLPQLLQIQFPLLERF